MYITYHLKWRSDTFERYFADFLENSGICFLIIVSISSCFFCPIFVRVICFSTIWSVFSTWHVARFNHAIDDAWRLPRVVWWSHQRSVIVSTVPPLAMSCLMMPNWIIVMSLFAKNTFHSKRWTAWLASIRDLKNPRPDFQLVKFFCEKHIVLVVNSLYINYILQAFYSLLWIEIFRKTTSNMVLYSAILCTFSSIFWHSSGVRFLILSKTV